MCVTSCVMCITGHMKLILGQCFQQLGSQIKALLSFKWTVRSLELTLFKTALSDFPLYSYFPPLLPSCLISSQTDYTFLKSITAVSLASWMSSLLVSHFFQYLFDLALFVCAFEASEHIMFGIKKDLENMPKVLPCLCSAIYRYEVSSTWPAHIPALSYESGFNFH